MNVRANLLLAGVLVAVASSGCGGQSSGSTSAPVPQAPGGSNADSRSEIRTYPLTGASRSFAFPPIGGFGGSLALPAASVPPNTSMQLTISLDAPANSPLLQNGERRMQFTGTLDVFLYATIRLSNTVTYPAPPGFSVTLSPTVDPAGLSFFYAISNPTPTNGAKLQYRTEGPAAVSGRTVTFAPSNTPLTLLAGKSYTIALYGATSTSAAATKIYVTNVAGTANNVTTYNADGTRSSPTITAALNDPEGIAVDRAGKIYVTSRYADPNTVTTYDADGTQTTPTITDGLVEPLGIAIDAAGKVYVVNGGNGAYNVLTTYNADGTRAAPTINLPGNPYDVAVDTTGKIYVTTDAGATLTTYNADGSRGIPTITGLNFPVGVAVDAAGRIYVAQFGNNTVTTYNSDGSRSGATITDGLNQPAGIAVDRSGKIYVANEGNNTVTTYNADGSRSSPTITDGVSAPFGIAVR